MSLRELESKPRIPPIEPTVHEALELLLEPGAVTELRALGTMKGTVSGYFTDPAATAQSASKLSGKAEGVYFTLNPVNSSLLARSSNHVKAYAKYTTSDADILRRRWLPLDFDPKRPAGVSSTDEEHRLALDRASKCREYLSGMGWPDPIVADSGNGCHLLYRIDLPNDADSTNLVKRLLEALALPFSDQDVELDTRTFNAARIWKLYGTLAAKGDGTHERPHRHATVLLRPALLKTVAREQLSALAIPEATPQQFQARNELQFDVPGFLAQHGIEIARQKPWQGGTCYILSVCPENAEHNRGESFVLQFANGAITAKCQHASCSFNWSSLREKYEPPTETRTEAMVKADAAIFAIRAAKPNISAEFAKRALDAIADVEDRIQRKLLEDRMAVATGRSLPKAMIVEEVNFRRQQREAEVLEISDQNRKAELRAMSVDAASLIGELETFFADRAHLPQGAALVLAYYALNTWTFKLFDTVPYLLLESAVPGCGKSTVIRLLVAVSC